MLKRFIFVLMLSLCVLLCAYAHAEILTVGLSDCEYQSLTDALEAARDGDEIVLSGGVYDESTETFPLMVEKSVIIRAKAGQTPIVAPPILTVGMKITAPYVWMEGITFEFLSSGLWVLADDATVAKCAFALADEQWSTSSCGLWVSGARRMTLTNSTFTGCGIALAGPPISESSKGLPVLTGMFEVGEDIAYFTSHNMKSNTVNGKPLAYVVGLCDADYSMEAGQLIAVKCQNTTFSRINVSRASIGLTLAYCNNVRVEAVTADQCGIFGIYIAKTTDCIITGAHANECAHGIDLRAVERCVVTDSVANENGQGIFFSFAWNSLAVRCEMMNNGTGFFSASGDANHVHACEISENELGMYIQHEPNFTLTDSQINNNTSCGTRIMEGGLTCMNNSFSGNWVATMALSSSPITYCGNFFSDNENRAIYVKDSGHVKLIHNIYDRGDAGQNEFVNSLEPLILP